MKILVSGIVINDRTIMHGLFQGLCFVFQLNDMSREDGLVSILRGFKKGRINWVFQKINSAKYTIHGLSSTNG
jgi:hypothetical protein